MLMLRARERAVRGEEIKERAGALRERIAARLLGEGEKMD